MSSYHRPWALCGGWAVDAWLGRISREHGDVDLSVFDADHDALLDHLAGWQLIAHVPGVDATSPETWDGSRLPVPSHIHGRAPADAGPLPQDGICMPAQGWWLDIQIDARQGRNGGSGDDWVLSREPLISVPLRNAIAECPWGLPAAVPEVLLFFKARDLRRADRLDFAALLPRLTREQRGWLRDALSRMPHPWLAELA
jgi:hypothetical protein